MRIVVMSDSHGDIETVRRIVEAHIAEADLFLHLGDGISEFRSVMEQYPQKKSIYVVGNHEDEFYHSNHFESLIITAEGHRIFLTHGDRLHTKLDTLELRYLGKKTNAEVVLFGHTHKAQDEAWEGIRFVNPGALYEPRVGAASYAIIDLDENGVEVRFSPV